MTIQWRDFIRLETEIGLFFWLQVLDVLSTLIFLYLGVAEFNWVVAQAMRRTHHLTALLEIKIIVMTVAWLRVTRGRSLMGINYLYCVFVAWNFTAIWYALQGMKG